MRPSVPDVHLTDAQDAEMASYRPLSGQSVAALIGGLSTPLALLGPAFWAVPVLGIFLSGWAFRRIKKNPSLAGRPLAMAGLLLSLLFLVAAPTNWLIYRHVVCEEARVFSNAWFQYLTQNEPQKAFQLVLRPADRRPLNDRLIPYYHNHPEAREGLQNYTQQPVVRAILALGPKAQIRFYQTASQTHANAEALDQIQQIYAITYEDNNEKKSFFVDVKMARTSLANGKAQWQILQTDGGVRPKGGAWSQQKP